MENLLEKMNSIKLKRFRKEKVKELENLVIEYRNKGTDFEEVNSELENKKNFIQEIDNKIEELEKRYNNKNLDKQNSTMEKRNFSLIQTIRELSENQILNPISQAVKNEARSLQSSVNDTLGQFQLPSVIEERALTVSDNGNDLVAVNIYDIMASVKNKSILTELGANWITGLSSNISIPKMSNLEQLVSWEGENDKVADKNPTFESVKFQPKRLSLSIPISKLLLIQNPNVEELIRSEIVTAITHKLESSIFGTSDDDSGKKVAGIFQNVEEVDKDFASLADFESELENYPNFKYALSPKTKAMMRTLPVSDGVRMVIDGKQIDGVDYSTSGFLPEKHFAIADWSKLYITQFGNFDITLDSVSLANQGMIKIIINGYFDAKFIDDKAVKVGKFA